MRKIFLLAQSLLLVACTATVPKAQVFPEGCSSRQEVDAYKQEIKDFYAEEDVLAKKQTPYGAVDCVRIEKQPSLKNSGLSAKNIPRAPLGSDGRPLESGSNEPPPSYACPTDTVPLTRPTLRELCMRKFIIEKTAPPTPY